MVAKTGVKGGKKVVKEVVEEAEEVAEGAAGKKAAKKKPNGDWFPDRKLPRDKHGNPIPETDAPHTQVGQAEGRKGKYPQAREFDGVGKPVRDIDITDHGRPGGHTNPHQHPYKPNPTGGTPQRGPGEPLP